MGIIRRKEVHDLGKTEIKEKIEELREELMSEKSKIAAGGLPDNAGKIKEIKKTIARLKTVAGERGYQINE